MIQTTGVDEYGPSDSHNISVPMGNQLFTSTAEAAIVSA
jgi:hypothetical protein